MKILLVTSLLVTSLCSPQPKNYVEIPHAKDCKTYWYLVSCGGK